MHLLSKSDAPDHRVDSLVHVATGHLRLVEMELEDYAVHLEHALKARHQHVALLDVSRLGVLEYLKVEALGEHAGEHTCAHGVALLEAIDDEPEMYLYHLGLDHIVMRYIEGRGELEGLYVIDDPDKYLFMYPFVVLAPLRVVAWPDQPLELQIIEVRPALV